MIQFARVIKTLNNDRALIEVQRESACGHDCSTCGGCSAPDTVVNSVAINTIGAKADDRVLIESSTSSVLGLSFIVYILPVLLFFLGYLSFGRITHLPDAANGFIGLLIGGIICWLTNKKMKYKNCLITIVQIL